MADGGNNIDNLSFGIILKDEDFKKKMGEVKSMAEKFSEDVEKALKLTKKLNALQGKSNGDGKKKADNEQKVVNLLREELELKKAEGTITKKELQTLNAILRNEKLESDIRKKETQELEAQTRLERQQVLLEKSKGTYTNANTTELHKQNAIMKGLTSMAAQYLSVFGAVSLVRNLVRITGEFEAQHTALRAILQDSAGADRIFYQLQELAVKSPYTFRDLTSYAKQLSAFSVPMDEIYETTKKLADVSAGLGVDMSRIILAYGQVRSAAFLRGQEVRQFTEAGIPILAELAKQFEEIEGHAISTGEVFDRISKRQVPFEMVEEAFRRMTSEGGKFYNMQEVLAETVKGKVSNLQDAWEIMLSRVGDANSGLIKGSISLVTELINNYEKLGKVIIDVTAAYGAYKAVLIATNALQSASVVSARFLAVTGGQISAIDVLLNRLFRTAKGGFSKILGVITKHPIAAAVGAVTAGLVALYFHIRKVNEATRETEKITTKAIADAEATKSSIHYYIQRLKEAKEGTEEYNEARKAVIENSRNFISSTDAERLSLQNVDDVWVNICNHIEEAMKLQAMQSVTAEAEARKQEKQMGVMEKLADYQQKHGLTNEVRQIVASFIRQEITEDELKRQLSGKLNNTDAWATLHGSEMGALLWNADKWWNDFYAAEREYYASIARARSNLNDLYGSGVKPTSIAPMPLEGWRVAVDDYLKAIGGGTRGMEVTSATDLASYIKKGADALDAARDALLHTPKDDADYKRLEEEIKFYEGISEAIYGSGFTEFDNTTNRYKTSQKELSKAQKERLAGLKQQVQDLKELKSAYDKFKSIGFDDKQINSILNNFFGVGVPNGGFNAAFESLASQMDKFSKNDAQDIRNFAAGKDVNAYAKKIEDAQKATEKWRESLEDLAATTKRLNLEGFAAELDKILVDTDSKNRKLTTDWAQNLKNLEESKDGWIENFKVAHPDEDAEKAWTSFYNGQKEALDALIKTQTEYNNKVAQGQVDKKADDWVKAMLDENGIDLTDWSDKTISQIDDIKTKLQGLKDQLPDLIPDELKDDADDVNVTFDNLLKLIEKILNAKIDLTDVERAKKELEQLTKDLQSVGKYLGRIGSALSKFGGDWEGIGDAFEGIGSAISSIADINQKVGSGQMSKAGGTLSYIMIAFENIVSVTADAIENFREMREATEAWNLELQQSAYEYERLQLARLEYEQANVFGVESPYSKALAATRKLRVAQEQLYGVTKQLSDIQIKTGQREAQDWGDTAKTVGSLTAAGASLGLAVGTVVPVIGNAIGAAVGAIVGLISGGITAAFTSKKMVDVFESLGSITGGKIFDPETLELADEVYANINNLDESSKAIVEHWDEIKDAMRESIDLFKENIEQLTGSLADDIKDALVNGFNNGDVYAAIDDVHDYVGKVIQDLMVEMAFATTLQPLFDELQKKMYHSWGLSDDGSRLLQGDEIDKAVDMDFTDDYAWFDEQFPKYIEGYKQAMEAARASLEAMGYDWNTGEDKSGNNLSNGIKSITEDTANLLASYLNAIRADVSYGKTQWERIAVAVEGHTTQYITLNDYMMQVQANTANIAESNRRILQEMQGFIRDFSLPSGYGESLKVQIVN